MLTPLPTQSTVDPTAFAEKLAALLNTPVSNIVLSPGQTFSNNSIEVTVSFNDGGSRERVQGEMTNLTTTERDNLGITEMAASPQQPPDANPEDSNWTFVYAALALICVLGLAGIVIFRKLANRMRDKKAEDSRHMSDFRKQLMEEYGEDAAFDHELSARRGSSRGGGVSHAETSEL